MSAESERREKKARDREREREKNAIKREKEREQLRVNKEKEKERNQLKIIKSRLLTACNERGVSHLCIDEMAKIVQSCNTSIPELFKERDWVSYGNKLAEAQRIWIENERKREEEERIKRLEYEKTFIGKVDVFIRKMLGLIGKIIRIIFRIAIYLLIVLIAFLILRACNPEQAKKITDMVHKENISQANTQEQIKKQEEEYYQAQQEAAQRQKKSKK